MLDTVDDPKRTFSGLTVEAVAAYGNGKFANYQAAKREFSHAHVLEIDVNGQGIGNAGDFEAGDMPASHAGSWAKGRIAAGIHRPVIYFSVSSWRAIMQSLKAAGLARHDVRIWTAHYNGKAHLCSADCGFGVEGAANATQWGSPQAPGTLHPPFAGRNVDVSMTGADFFGGAHAPGPGPRPTPTAAPQFPGRKLRQPPVMTGEDVRTWQVQMAHRGWSIVASGSYDAATEKVCRKFQTEKGLEVDGVVGADTWQAAWTAAIT
ncbi:MAG TPA: peptidoglycan-binding domain-containing protein [Solirubrobacteraceae bacterium]|nr:peptidoglycan-binding domain-containing protein [Solirubrobacteraceae bacterium]